MSTDVMTKTGVYHTKIMLIFFQVIDCDDDDDDDNDDDDDDDDDDCDGND